MRRLSLIDLLVVAGLVALLLLAARAEIGRFEGRTIPRAMPAPSGGEAAR